MKYVYGCVCQVIFMERLKVLKWTFPPYSVFKKLHDTHSTHYPAICDIVHIWEKLISRKVLIKSSLSGYYHSTPTLVYLAWILNTISWERVRLSVGRALLLSLIYIPSSRCPGYHGSKELDSNTAIEGWSRWREEGADNVGLWVRQGVDGLSLTCMLLPHMHFCIRTITSVQAVVFGCIWIPFLCHAKRSWNDLFVRGKMNLKSYYLTTNRP